MERVESGRMKSRTTAGERERGGGGGGRGGEVGEARAEGSAGMETKGRESSKGEGKPSTGRSAAADDDDEEEEETSTRGGCVGGYDESGDGNECGK